MEISGITNDTPLRIQQQLDSAKASQTDSFQAALGSAMESKDKAQLKKACVEFESYFIQMMFKEMRKSVNTSGGILPKGQAEQIFESMLDEEVAKESAKGKGIGLADMMYRQMENSVE